VNVLVPRTVSSTRPAPPITIAVTLEPLCVIVTAMPVVWLPTLQFDRLQPLSRLVSAIV